MPDALTSPAEPAPGDDQLADLRAIAERATTRPLMVSDCDGEIHVWAESALTHVVRDADGHITGYSFPGSYRACDNVISFDLDGGTWDPGEDPDDDQRRQDINDLVDARAALPGLFARIARLEAAAAKVADFVAARAEYITAINNCHPENAHDYNRWQGHAESRRQLAETLGLPVAWPTTTTTEQG